MLSVIECYALDFVKFDFNDGVSYDPSRTGFYRYFVGYRQFIEAIRSAYPDLYIENCASGGERVDMHSLSLSDSFWYSDNQSVHDGIDIIAGTMRRVPPNCLDRWVVAQSVPGFMSYMSPTPIHQLMGCENATWTRLQSISPSWLERFLTGSVCGLSCDLETLDETTREHLKDYFKRFKENRPFWIKAVGSLLCDTAHLMALQYADPELNRSVLCVFVKKRRQDSVVLYPRVRADALYLCGEGRRSGQSLLEDGLTLKLPEQTEALIVEISCVD